MVWWPQLLAVLFASICTGFPAAQQTVPGKPGGTRPAPELTLAAAASELQLREGLVVGLLGSYGRNAVPSDLLAWQIATGAFKTPREGDVLGPDDRNRTQVWTRVTAGTDGWFQHRALSGGHLYTVVNSVRARTMILDASGYYVVRVNGEPRGGERYGTDWVRHPVRLRAGPNVLLFQGERGRIRARLFEPPAPVFFTDSDATLPDLIPGETSAVWAGLRLVNATEEPVDTVEISYRLGDESGTTRVPVVIPPLMTRKLPVRLAVRAPETQGAVTLALTGRVRIGHRLIETPPFALALNVVAPAAYHVRTFLSEIDGSVQYYGVVPPTGGRTADGTRPALVISLHGAGVEAINQARAYKPKDWAFIVTPTNRRPYGFDWEDWGRLDALEVLADASRLFNTDPARTYLTGHSMGGHGTWHIGVTHPDLWAAIAPSAGWRSFSSYGGGTVYNDPTAVEQMLARANHPGETTELARNLLHYGVYILHGERDDNVPVTQARFMRELLARFHPDFSYYERPGAGHWWGDECVDWPPLIDFLRAHTRQSDSEVSRVEFVTANPGISSRSRFVTIVAQQRPLEYSRAIIDRDPRTGAFKGTTENVTRLWLEPTAGAADRAIDVELDGVRIAASRPADGWLRLERRPSGWHQTMGAESGLKGPNRAGGFKDAFRHRVVLVYGTRGTADETARSYQKARFDAETFWYRGNGSFDVVADTAFDPASQRGRNVVLYGNADTNACWRTLLGDGPIEIRNGRARVGDRQFEGSAIGACFIRPRPDSPDTSVGAVAWTGPAGWMAVGHGQYFVSGAGYPDLLIVTADVLRAGTAGVLAVGWFGEDWSLEHGDIVWGPGGTPSRLPGVPPLPPTDRHPEGAATQNARHPG